MKRWPLALATTSGRRPVWLRVAGSAPGPAAQPAQLDAARAVMGLARRNCRRLDRGFIVPAD